MESTLDMVLRRRHLVRCVIRAGVVILACLVVFLFLLEFFQRIPYGWGTIVERPFFSFRFQLAAGGAIALVSVIAWMFQNWIARIIVPIPRHECPQCGYTLQKLTTSRCPECGFVFASQPEREPSPPR